MQLLYYVYTWYFALNTLIKSLCQIRGPLPTNSKCDEDKPSCTKCVGHGISCSYLRTQHFESNPSFAQRSQSPRNKIPSQESSAPSQTFSDLSTNFSVLDLELLHFGTTSNVFNFTNLPSGANIFRTTFIEIALEHMFLMHEILSLSALHLAHLKPNKSVIYRTAAATHHAAALLLFQPQLSNLTPENCNACFAFSALLSIHIWASQSPAEISNLFFSSESSENPDTPKITWFKLLRGSRAVIRAGWPWIEAGPLSPVFKP